MYTHIYIVRYVWKVNILQYYLWNRVESVCGQMHKLFFKLENAHPRRDSASSPQQMQMQF